MSTIYVDNLRSNLSTKITVPSGNTLDVSGATFTPPAGHVIQTVTMASDNTVSTQINTVTTWTDVGFSISITPTSTSSKILIMHFSGGIVTNSGYHGVRLLRDSTVVARNWQYNNDANWFPASGAIIYLDSPATTSSITYKIQGYMSTSGGDFRYNYSGPGGATPAKSNMIAQEIAG